MSTTIDAPTNKQRTRKSDRIRRKRQVASRDNKVADGDSIVLHPRDRQMPFNEETVRFRSPQLRAKSNRTAIFRDLSLENCFTSFGVVVAVTLITLCTLDLVIAWPWMRFSRLFDVTFLACGWMLIAMCYETIKDQSASSHRT